MGLERVVVVGDSCSGKTVLSRALGARLDHPHIELDQLYWGPRWTPRPLDDFRASVEEAVAGARWIVDGNYHRMIELVWSRATALVWLDYPLPLVLARGLKRSIRRSLRAEPLFAGNRESLRRSFLSHDSLLLWILTSRGPRRRRYCQLLEERRFPRLEVHRLGSPRATDRWLERVVAPNEHRC